ncbi:MAG: hypothetical protein ABSG82_07615 [Sedimentisphaerales bacterium]|jgi:hypothetical protein
MKKYVMGLAGVVVACVLLGFVSNAPAADANKPKEAGKEKQTHVVGTVNEVKDQNGIVTEVTVKSPKETYQITLDTKGKELGQTMDGKKVKVSGTLEVKNGVKWLTVEKYSEETSPKHKEKPPKNN